MIRPFALALLAGTALVPSALSAQALPSGGSVVAGSAQIGGPQAGALAIIQASQRAVIDWQSFSVGQGGHVDIRQPGADAALLNRVTGNATSTIAGQITANGQVYLVNPNGIVITKTGSVNAAGFVASTLGISNADFMAGRLNFMGTGGRVGNAGSIAVVRGGYAALLGGQVDNSGFIAAPLGRIGLGAAARATLDLAGDGFLQVTMPTRTDGGVAVSGMVSANGGSIVMATADARDAARHTINLTGVVEARGLEGRSGSVTLTGGDVTLAGALIDVSGAAGGGRVRIGGDIQGGGTLAHADTVSVDAGSHILADAVGSGNGGNITIWSDTRTDFAGSISARGTGGGHGGDAEVSSKAALAYSGSADLRGATFGTLLLDPYDVTISTAADSNNANFVATGDNSNINNATLQNALGLANVTVSTGSGGNQAGNITVAAPLAWATNATLTLQAAGGIALNSSIAAAAGGLVLTAGGTITPAATSSIAVATLTQTAGNWRENGTLSTLATGDFRLLGGTFVRATGGGGTAANPYILTDIYGVQGIAGLLAANYRLANDIDASTTVNWSGGLGFAPIGTAAAGLTGSLDGGGHAIVNLTINRSGTAAVGLFARNDGTVQRVGLTGGAVTGGTNTGAVIGINAGTATNLYNDAPVTGAAGVGGIVGSNTGNLTQSYNIGTVSGSSQAGGLVGSNAGTIDQSWSSGVVQQGGGLVGASTGGVTNSYWDTQTSGQTSSAGGTGLTTAQARGQAGYAGFDFANVWYQSGTLRPILRSQGNATVTNVVQLQLIDANRGGTFTIANDIDATATRGANPAGLFGSTGFSPIGPSQANAFTGTLNGNSRQISNLFVAAASGPVGLFGQTMNATIRNVALRGVSITGTGATGGIVGYGQDTTISGSSVTGSVVGSTSVGGLAGVFSGSVATSQSAADVVGGNTGGGFTTFTGGLVGILVVGAVPNQINTSSATGSVRGGGIVGGLIGDVSGLDVVSDSYSTASVLGLGQDPVGGLIGELASGTVQRSYASGSVQGVAAGGLFGRRGGVATAVADYWDTQSTGQANAVATGSNVGTTGLTTAQARTPAAYAGFDFGNVWFQVGDSRPFLRSEGHAAVNGVTAVDSLAGLALMATNLAGAYRVTENIDASASAPTASQAGVFGATGFIPVGSSAGNAFTGTFDGQGHTITGLTEVGRTTLGSGLFGYTNGATIQNVALVGGSIGGSGSVGGLVGSAQNTTIAYVTNSGRVTGTFDNVGGLVGLQTGGLVTDSSTTGAVAGRQQVGGLVGQNAGGTIRWTYATGAVSGQGYVGGLIGYNVSGTVGTSYALGTVTSTGLYAGGFVGANTQGSNILQAYAQGNVTGTDFVGGFAGNTDGGGSIIQAYAANAVAGTNGATHVGAFAGANSIPGGGNNALTALAYTYYDSTLANGLPALGTSNNQSAVPVGLTTPVAQNFNGYQTTYVGFDFDNIWVPPNQAGQNGIATAHYPEFGRLSKAVVVRPVTATRVYGNANPNLIAVYSFVRGGDFVTSPGTVTTPATVLSDVGNYDLTVSNVAVATTTPPAYRVVTLPGTLSVTVRPLTVTGGLITLPYGSAIPTTTSNLAVPTGTSLSGVGLVNGDAIGSAAVTNATASPTSNVGTYSYLPANATFSSGKASNYALSYATGPIQIAARAITVTPDGQTRVYGDANPTTGTASSAGLVNNDTITSVALTSPATAASNVGSYELDASNAVFGQGSAANYAISYLPNTTGLTVTARPVTVAADAQSRVYGNSNPALTYTVGGRGLVNGDTLTGALATPATLTSAVGGYAITQGSLAASNNYAVTYIGNTLTVTPRPLLIGGGTIARTYGDANPATTTALVVAQGTSTSGSGLVNGDTVSQAAVTNATATPASGVGNYAYTPANATFSAGAASNYAITYADGTLQVTARPLTVTADNKSRAYGDANPALTYMIGAGGLVNGDMLTGGLATAATPQSMVGSYAITQGSLAAGANYTIAFVPGTLLVTPRSLSIAPTPLTSTYGDAPPTTGTAVPTGLVNTDTVTGVTLTTPATTTSPVGSYGLTPSNAVGTGLGNYTITYVTLPNGLTIAARPITIVANAASRTYGDANPSLTYTVGGRGLVNGDALTGALATTATVATGVGSYAIVPGTLANPNYQVTAFSGNTLSITARPLVVTADAQYRLVGQPIGTLSYTVGQRGLVNGDTLSGTLATSATPAGAIGFYPITQGSLSASANYALTVVPGTLLLTGIAPAQTATLAGNEVRDVFRASYNDQGIANLIVLPPSATTASVAFESVEPTLSPTCPRGAPCPDNVKASGTGVRTYDQASTAPIRTERTR